MIQRTSWAVVLFLAVASSAPAEDLRNVVPPAPALPPDMKAVPVWPYPETVTGGFPVPGCRVDVVWHVPCEDGQLPRKIVENALILAVDRDNQFREVVILELTPA